LELTFNADIKGCSKSHVHDKITLVALYEGEVIVHLKNIDIVLEEKTLTVINPYQIHKATKKDENSQGLYSLYLDKKWIQKLQYDLFQNEEYFLFPKVVVDDKNTYLDFVKLCQNIFDDDFSIKIEEEIIEFISNLMIQNYDKKLAVSKNILFCDIKKYIDKNLTLNISLEEISKQFLITAFHLIRIFKKELQLTPYQYILNQKVNLAKELLSQKLSISEVALMTGFNDQSHLYKYFQQIFSYTPKEYQDSLIK